MTAEFLVAALPACDLSGGRLAELHQTVDRLAPADLLPEGPTAEADAATLLAELRRDLYQHVGRLAHADASAEVTSIRLPGMPYAVWVTGGLSWGDPPTDFHDAFSRLAECPVLLRLLEGWARQDAAWADAEGLAGVGAADPSGG